MLSKLQWSYIDLSWCNSDQKLTQSNVVSECVMPDLSSLILHAQDIHLAPSLSPQCGASVSGDHTTAPQLPASSRIEHQIHVFRLTTNCVWQMGFWKGREDGAGTAQERLGLCLARSHHPSPAGRQELHSCNPTSLSLPHTESQAESSCKNKTK